MKLCYIEDKWAYFTSGPIVGPEKQWGDDWNNAPYEYNAEVPYFGGPNDRYVIVKLAYEGPVLTPGEGAELLGNGASNVSVEQINRGEVPWLETSKWASSPHVTIHAGTDIEAFERLIQYASGKVYKLSEGEPDKPEETRPCLFCLKPLEDAADNGFATYQPHGGGEVQFNFAYGSCKFDKNMDRTNYRALVCDECAEDFVGRMQEF